MRGRDCWPEDPEELAKRHAHRGDRACLDDEKQSPSVKKSPERAERLAQINILPARARHHGGEFAIRKRADDGEKAGDEPCTDQRSEERRVGKEWRCRW